MSYNKKDIFLATMLMLFIISLAIVFTVFFKQLYYLDINYLGIDLTSGMSSGFQNIPNKEVDKGTQE